MSRAKAVCWFPELLGSPALVIAASTCLPNGYARQQRSF